MHATTSTPSQPGPSSSLTPELVQQMILNAFSAFGFSDTSSPSSTWFIDSGASNHMTNSHTPFSNLTSYNGHLQIQTADGGHVPITAVNNIHGPIPLKNVYLCPNLTSNLLSV